MELIKPGTNFDFIRFRFVALGISWALIAIGIVLAAPPRRPELRHRLLRRASWCTCASTQAQSINDIRDALEQRAISATSTIQDFGAGEHRVPHPPAGRSQRDRRASATR